MKLFYCFLIVLTCLNLGCSPQKKYGKPQVEVNELESDFLKWWTYHYDNIILSKDFIPINELDQIISKNDFFEKLITGNYMPIELSSHDDSLYYKLFKLSKLADKDVRKVIKNTSSTSFRYFKSEGLEFPKFNFSDLKGVNYSSLNTKGKVLIIKCWFVNCKPCVQEFPELNELVKDYKNKKDTIFISLVRDSSEDLEKFLLRKNLNYSHIANQKEFIKNDLSVNEFPTHIVVGEDGLIRKVVNNSSDLISYISSKKVARKKFGDMPPPPPPSM